MRHALFAPLSSHAYLPSTRMAGSARMARHVRSRFCYVDRCCAAMGLGGFFNQAFPPAIALRSRQTWPSYAAFRGGAGESFLRHAWLFFGGIIFRLGLDRQNALGFHSTDARSRIVA